MNISSRPVRLTRSLLVAMCLSLVSVSAWAHHSAAMFDMAKCEERVGTIRTFQFQYPHSWVWVYLVNAAGVQEVWGFESVSPPQLMEVDPRWTSALLKKGDKVTVEFNPLRDGRNGGLLQSMVLPDGSTINGWNPVVCKRAVGNKAK